MFEKASNITGTTWSDKKKKKKKTDLLTELVFPYMQ